MNKHIKFWVFIALVALFSTGCSTENTSGKGQGGTPKPLPKVRVEAMPSATASQPLPVVEQAAPTPEPGATATAALIYYDPTPDGDAIANQIESMLDEIDRKLKSENFLLK